LTKIFVVGKFFRKKEKNKYSSFLRSNEKNSRNSNNFNPFQYSKILFKTHDFLSKGIQINSEKAEETFLD